MRRLPVALALAVAVACADPQPCPDPLEECGGQCVDVQSDPRHCGGCGGLCPPGQVCTAAGCTSGARTACTGRTGGAFVTLGHCGAAVKIWVRDAAFIAAAKALLGVPPDPTQAPSLTVIAGSDCDAQWSWHADDLAASFAAADPSCTVCPLAIEANVQAYVTSVRRWCPVGASVLAVDERPPPP